MGSAGGIQSSAWGAGGTGKTKPTATGRMGADNFGNTWDDPTGLVVGCTQGMIKGKFVKSTAQAKQQKARFHPKGSTKAHPNFFLLCLFLTGLTSGTSRLRVGSSPKRPSGPLLLLQPPGTATQLPGPTHPPSTFLPRATSPGRGRPPPQDPQRKRHWENHGGAAWGRAHTPRPHCLPGDLSCSP